MAQRITQSLIYAEVQNVKEIIKVHTEQDNKNFQDLRQLLEGSDAAPGMKVRVDRLEQAELAKRRHFGYLWAAVTACGAAAVGALLL